MSFANRDTNELYEVVQVGMQKVILEKDGERIEMPREEFQKEYFQVEAKGKKEKVEEDKTDIFTKLEEKGFKPSNKNSLENKTYSKMSSEEKLNELLNA